MFTARTMYFDKQIKLCACLSVLFYCLAFIAYFNVVRSKVNLDLSQFTLCDFVLCGFFLRDPENYSGMGVVDFDIIFFSKF